MNRFFKTALLLTFIFFVSYARGEEAKLLKIGGEFLIKSIEKENSSFVVVFKAQDGGKDLVLHTDHIHVGLQTGSKLRLSAEVTHEGNVLEINQVMVFMPIAEGVKPIWMLSRTFKNGYLPSRYIEMHDPQSDYILF
jgi:hypothetical protein